MKKLFTLMLVIVLTLILECTGNSGEADLIVINGAIWTGNDSMPRAEAFAVKSDKIIAVGGTEEIWKYKNSSTEVIDAEGKFITPGFIDSHVHFIEGGFHLSSVQLRDASTKEEFVKRIKEFAETVDDGTWITGGDWDHEMWGGELPRKEWIDKVTPKHPVWIARLDGHMALANSLALEIAGVNESTPDIEGGTIVKDKSGKPTGVLKDNAMSLVYRVVPDPTDQLNDKALEAAMNYVASLGVTSVHHMGGWGNLATFRRAHDSGKLITRIYAAVPLSTWSKLSGDIKQNGTGDNWLKTGVLKGFVDGSLGSHTAAFFEPFTDAPTDTGLMVNTIEDLYKWISNADKNNLHVVVHAIGDRAISDLLDIYDKVGLENGDRDRRFRIEHSQHIAPKDFTRYDSLNVIASMQPYHAIDDGRWAEKVIGPERIKTTYAFRTLLDNNVKLALGSDWFVAPPDHLYGIYAAVTRRTLDGANPDGWVSEQKITVEEALRGYTIDAAYASFDENIKGSIETGKLADFVILAEDITKIDPAKIKDVKVEMTFVGGKKVFESND